MTNTPKDGGAVYLSVDIRLFDHAPQLSINGSDSGYRIAGAKYDGKSKCLLRHELSAQDVKEIRSYCDEAERWLAERNKQ